MNITIAGKLFQRTLWTICGLGLVVSAGMYGKDVYTYTEPLVKSAYHRISDVASSKSQAERLSRKANHDLEFKLMEENDLGLADEYMFNSDALKKYRGWIDQTVEESREKKEYAIVVDKAAYELTLYKDGKAIEKMPIELGTNPIDDKFIEGDKATPEGMYRVNWVRDKGNTKFYRALMIDYPNKTDENELNKLKSAGLLPKKLKAGSHIEIHGMGEEDPEFRTNWTLGCIALSNNNIDKLFDYGLKNGTPVTIVRYGTKEKYDF